MSQNLRDVIKSFKYGGNEARDPVLKFSTGTKITKPSPTKNKSFHRKSHLAVDENEQVSLKDLPSSIVPDLSIVFVGFNPGIESSKQQHHYAHPTNLFWKLFNASDILSAVLDMRDTEYKVHEELLNEVYHNGISVAKPNHDFRLAEVGIGFTDLVLRCTKQASQLSKQEKAENVPRLFREFQASLAPFVVFIGKGIWEVVCKYLIPKHKLTTDNFSWGLQEDPVVLTRFHALCKTKPKVYVFPNTSGLVASMKYPEKLHLWKCLVQDIQSG